MKIYLKALVYFIFFRVVYAYDMPQEYKYALALMENGHRVEASRVLKGLIAKYPDWGLFYLEYAANCFYIECPEDEIDSNLNKAQGLLVDNPRVYYYRGLLIENKNMQEALNLYDKAISLRFDYIDALVRACILYANKGDVKSAISYYDSIPADKRNSALVLKIFNLLMIEKNYVRAERELLWLVKNHPSNELYLTKLLDFYNAIGDKQKAKEVSKNLKRLSPEKKKIMRPLR